MIAYRRPVARRTAHHGPRIDARRWKAGKRRVSWAGTPARRDAYGPCSDKVSSLTSRGLDVLD
jgi:hypothetical protein